LLDEPLSALDAKVRVSLRNEIRRIQQQLKMTAIYVTHDQEEALAISDRIAVMAKGKIEQLDQKESADYSANGVGNRIAGTIILRTFLGPFTRFHVQVNEETTLTADVPSQQACELYVAQPVVLSFAAEVCQVLPLDSSIRDAEKITESEKV